MGFWLKCGVRLFQYRQILLKVTAAGRQTSSSTIFVTLSGNSLGLCNEMAVLLSLVEDLGYLANGKELAAKYDELGKRIYRLCEKWEQK